MAGKSCGQQRTAIVVRPAQPQLGPEPTPV